MWKPDKEWAGIERERTKKGSKCWEAKRRPAALNKWMAGKKDLTGCKEKEDETKRDGMCV